MRLIAVTALVAAGISGCSTAQPETPTGYVVPTKMEEREPPQVLEVPVPVAVEVTPPADKPRKKVSETRAAEMISGTRIMVDPKHAIGGTYTPAWMDGYPITVYASVNTNTDIEFPVGAYLDGFLGSDMEDGTGEGEAAGWAVKTSYAGRGESAMYKAHLMPRYPKLKTQFTANLTMPDGSPLTMIFRAQSFETTRMNAVRPIVEAMEQERMNDALASRATDRKAVSSSANSGNKNICGVGSDTKYNVVVDEPGLEWAQITRGKVYNDGRMTCIEFPPEGPRQELPSVMIVMGKGQEFTANCTLMGRHYVCDGVPTRLRLRGTDLGIMTLERSGS
jgi:hypothetical protein